MQNNMMPTGQQQAVGKTNAVTNNAVVAAEIAKVQAQCVLAINNPRNLRQVEQSIEGMCSSVYLAKEAEYEYTRGGARITGPTIKLMSAIAQCYKNITSGWTELSRTKDKSKISAWAWDLENNYKNELEFEVPLYRETKSGRTLLTSDRDIYELIANYAARRVRKCIESVIPRYLVDMAIEKCHNTLESKIDVKTELKKLINWLKSYHDIDLAQVEEKLGMKYEAFSNVQYTTILKWCNALRDGTISKTELFPSKEAKNQTISDVTKQQKEENGSIQPKPVENVEENNMFSETSDNGDWMENMLGIYGDH